MKKRVLTALNNNLVNIFLKKSVKDYVDVIVGDLSEQDVLIAITTREQPDAIVISDKLIGELKICELIQMLIEQSYLGKIIIMTAVGEDNYRDMLIGAGAFDVLADRKSDVHWLIDMIVYDKHIEEILLHTQARDEAAVVMEQQVSIDQNTVAEQKVVIEQQAQIHQQTQPEQQAQIHQQTQLEQQAQIHQQTQLEQQATGNSFKLRATPESPVKVVYRLPDSYKTAIAICGARRTGKTFLASLIAKNLARKQNKVAIADFTANRTLYGWHVWGKNIVRHDDWLENPYAIDDEMLLFTSSSMKHIHLPFQDVFEILSSDSDIVILDTDASTPRELFKYVQKIFIVQDMDQYSLLENSSFLASLKETGVNMKKVSIIVNAFLNCDTGLREILQWLSVRQGFEKSVTRVGNSSKTLSVSENIDSMSIDNYEASSSCGVEELLHEPQIFKVPFVLRDHITRTNRAYEGEDTLKGYSIELMNAIDDICESIYPYERDRPGWIAKLLG